MKITEARLRQIIREELAVHREGAFGGENEEALGAEDAGFDLAMSGMPYKLPDWIRAGSSLESYFIKGFDQGEHEFGVRHEGEEGEDALDEMYGGYGRSGSRGGYQGSAYSGFAPVQARALARKLASMGRNRSLHTGDQKALNNWVGQQKFSTSREAKAAIIKYLVAKRFGNPVDYR